MSRVHDALRKVDASLLNTPGQPPVVSPAGAGVPPGAPAEVVPAAATVAAPVASPAAVALEHPGVEVPDVVSILPRVGTIPFLPSPDASLLDQTRPSEAPAEEFRSLRTRLNHMQNLQPIHTVVVTSASPAEGKSFTATNLALAQAHLEGNKVLLADFDFRRPVVHNLFQFQRTPGATDYLQGKAKLEEVIRRVEGTNFYVMPAGEAVMNPLELLNLPQVKALLEGLAKAFNWVVLDTPPLLFAADANLLSTLSDGLILVVRIGTTTIDSVTRAIGSLCQNNILGIVVNGAHRGELYSKYTYYHTYYYSKPE
jgi:receptor protein-tyrosine kinase